MTQLVVVLALLFGSIADATAQTPIKVRFAWQPYNTVLFYTARDLKLFEKAGLDAELVKFTAGPPQFAAYRSESIDAGLFGTAGYVVGLSQGLDLKNSTFRSCPLMPTAWWCGRTAASRRSRI